MNTEAIASEFEKRADELDRQRELVGKTARLRKQGQAFAYREAARVIRSIKQEPWKRTRQ